MSLPSDYSNEISALDREILKHQPHDILQFCANFFNRRLESQRTEALLSQQHSSPQGRGLADNTFPGNNPFSTSPSGGAPAKSPMQRLEEEEENDTMTSPTASTFGAIDFGKPRGGNNNNNNNVSNGSGSGGNSAFGDFQGFAGSSKSNITQMPPLAGDGQSFPSNYNTNRRTSVSAESLNPASSAAGDFTAPFHQKTQEQLSRLRAAVSGNFLFSHLDDDQSSLVLGALHEKPIPTKGIKVISQGDVGDYFYVVEKGAFDIYVNKSGKLEAGPDGIGNKVGSVGPGGSFGELALMYNAPRAATVVSTESSTLWALDRVTFRRILMDSAFQRRRMYEGFLDQVPLLSTLTPYERSKIADALETKKYPPGSTIIQEGDVGESFYLLESGDAQVFKRGVDTAVKDYTKGDYFGELALLNDAPRAASVVSRTEVKVATLGKNGFQRLLGPVEGIMRRNDPSKPGFAGDHVDPLSKAT
ncbi:camp-dependent protein kinase-like protein regulatory subunit [Plenodomus tracheiphilus IPT5]|uniref:cAMP-dependent protein kinase regulatory subunit n=1 Tax=Plenodomus tracheiphilus IPT5 TaxID=1408161 RepID=A0A6A7AYS2_9PLEO|nr:camp-dependent protein kinase-like protein regulatory subunit [Plenodomus tracheiphilus IPT5]